MAGMSRGNLGACGAVYNYSLTPHEPIDQSIPSIPSRAKQGARNSCPNSPTYSSWGPWSGTPGTKKDSPLRFTPERIFFWFILGFISADLSKKKVCKNAIWGPFSSPPSKKKSGTFCQKIFCTGGGFDFSSGGEKGSRFAPPPARLVSCLGRYPSFPLFHTVQPQK